MPRRRHIFHTLRFHCCHMPRLIAITLRQPMPLHAAACHAAFDDAITRCAATMLPLRPHYSAPLLYSTRDNTRICYAMLFHYAAQRLRQICRCWRLRFRCFSMLLDDYAAPFLLFRYCQPMRRRDCQPCHEPLATSRLLEARAMMMIIHHCCFA